MGPDQLGPHRPSGAGPTGAASTNGAGSTGAASTWGRIGLGPLGFGAGSTYRGPALVDPAPLFIRYISLVILSSYLRLTMVRSWSIRSHFANKTIFIWSFLKPSYIWLTMVRSWSIRPHFNCTLRPNVSALTLFMVSLTYVVYILLLSPNLCYSN